MNLQYRRVFNASIKFYINYPHKCKLGWIMTLKSYRNKNGYLFGNGMYRCTKFFIRILLSALLLLLFFLSSYYIGYLYAENEALRNSTPLSFVKVFPLTTQEGRIGQSGVSIGIKVEAQLMYRVDVILLTSYSNKYSEKGKSATLKIEASNVISLLELIGNTNTYFEYPGGRIDVPLRPINIKYAIPETIGIPQNVIMGEYLIYTGTVPIVGALQISIFMRPTVRYTPNLRGNVLLQGPVLISPQNLYWNQKSVTAELHFTENSPVNVFLADPELILKGFRMILEVYAIIGIVSTPPMELEIVSLGDFSLSSPIVNLVSFEPNYYALYREISAILQQVQQSLDALAVKYRDFESSLNTLSQNVANLQLQVNQLASLPQPLSLSQPWIIATAAIALAALSLVVSLYSLSKQRKS